VLIVCDDAGISSVWTYILQEKGWITILEASARNTVDRWATENPDLITLDISLPESHNIELIKKLRAETVVPIMLLTASRSEEFMLEAYDAGVDDCILKPISPSLLNAKVKVWLRRSASVPTSTLETVKIGKLCLIPSDRKIKVGDNDPVRLSNLEFRLLYVLMNRPDQTVAIEELNQRVWGYSGETGITMIKNVVYRLRRKIEINPTHPQVIQYVTGVGYKFVHE